MITVRSTVPGPLLETVTEPEMVVPCSEGGSFQSKVRTGSDLLVKVRESSCGGLLESLTPIVTSYSAADAAEPEMLPVLGSNCKPGGKEPRTIRHLSGAVPAVACRRWKQGWSTTHGS